MTGCPSENHRYCECDGCSNRIYNLETELDQYRHDFPIVAKERDYWIKMALELQVDVGTSIRERDALKARLDAFLKEGWSDRAEAEVNALRTTNNYWQKTAAHWATEAERLKTRIVELERLLYRATHGMTVEGGGREKGKY